MKNFLTIIAGLMIIAPTFATTMCAINDSVSVVLDPSISITNYSPNNPMGKWSAWAAYGTIHGISACLKSNKGKGLGGTVPHLHDTDNDGNDHLVTGSEKYGRYCWCRLTHPVSSLWMYDWDMGSGSGCAGDCARSCSYHLIQYPYRGLPALFGSVQN